MKEPYLVAFAKEDNWKNFSYDYRVLDSLASIVHFKSPCTAVIKYKDVLYVSYNCHIATNEKASTKRLMDLMYETIMNGNQEKLITTYLLFNIDYIEFIRNQITHTKSGILKDVLETFNQLHKNYKVDVFKKLKTGGTLIDLGDYKKIAETYFSIVTNIDVKNEKNIEVKEILLRPLQDCYKVIHCIKNGYKVDKIEILDNKEELHADSNIINYFPFQNQVEYVGVSKLCCGHCHGYLQEKLVQHRGTHGIIDTEWKILPSIQSEGFKEWILQKVEKFQGDLFQNRRLSFDEEIEKDIFLEESFSLFNLKEQLGLIGEVHYTDIPESIYLNTSGYGGGCTI